MESRQLSPRRRAYDRVMRFFLYACAGLTCLLLVVIIGYIFFRGVPNITWELLTSQQSVIREVDGILPNIINTLVLIFGTLLFVLPLGVGAAIYLTEYARNKRVAALIEFATETLTGIPSIIFGLVGMLFFCQMLGWGGSIRAGIATLVIMTIPTIVRTTQESLKTVPQSYREAALGLGSGKWRMVRTVVLPSSVDGIVTGCILSIGRIVGESAALLYTAGGTAMFMKSLGQVLTMPGASLSVGLYTYSMERGKIDVGFAIATILMLITLCINLLAKWLGRRLKR